MDLIISCNFFKICSLTPKVYSVSQHIYLVSTMAELTASEVEKSKAREENKPNFYKKKNARRNVTKGSDVKLLRGVGFSISRSGPDQ